MSLVDCTNPRQFSYDPELGVCFRTLDFLGHPGYRVGDDGSVWSRREAGRIRSGKGGTRPAMGNTWRRIGRNGTARGGYPRVLLMGPNHSQEFRVHQLILITFVGPCPAEMECLHDDGNPMNNQLSNLWWGTSQQNADDRTRHGHSHKGSEHSRSKVNEEQVRKIWMLKGKRTQSQLSKRFGVSMSCIGHIHNRRVWTHVTDNL